MPSNRHEFADHCCELLSTSLERPCLARRMFGGHGISSEGLTFALVLGETLYLKTDPANTQPWIAAGCQPFVYQSRGRSVQLHYHSAPDEALESPVDMAPWARLAFACALQAQARKLARPVRRRTG